MKNINGYPLQAVLIERKKKMGNSMKEVASWLGMIGVPSIFAMTVFCVRAIASFFKQLKILQEAQKAQMRGQLMDKYYELKNRGFAWDDEITEWSNQYTAYHALKGPNEVLDARKDEILKIPSKQR